MPASLQPLGLSFSLFARLGRSASASLFPFRMFFILFPRDLFHKLFILLLAFCALYGVDPDSVEPEGFFLSFPFFALFFISAKSVYTLSFSSTINPAFPQSHSGHFLFFQARTPAPSLSLFIGTRSFISSSPSLRPLFCRVFQHFRELFPSPSPLKPLSRPPLPPAG